MANAAPAAGGNVLSKAWNAWDGLNGSIAKYAAPGLFLPFLFGYDGMNQQLHPGASIWDGITGFYSNIFNGNVIPGVQHYATSAANTLAGTYDYFMSGVSFGAGTAPVASTAVATQAVGFGSTFSAASGAAFHTAALTTTGTAAAATTGTALLTSSAASAGTAFSTAAATTAGAGATSAMGAAVMTVLKPIAAMTITATTGIPVPLPV